MNLWPFSRKTQIPPAVEHKPDLAAFLVDLAATRKETLAHALCFSSLAGVQPELGQMLRDAYGRIIELRDELWREKLAGHPLFKDLPADREAFLDQIDGAAHRLASKDERCAEMVRLFATRLMLD